MTASQRKGTEWESRIVAFLKPYLPHVERRAKNGAKDRGDIAGLIGVVIEAKARTGHSELTGWVGEAEVERANDNAELAVVWSKVRGKASPADGLVTMTGAAWVKLMQEAGRIPGVES